MEIPSNLEQEIADIERRLAEKKTALQQAQGEQPVQEREILNEVISEKAQESVPNYQPSAPTSTQSTAPFTDNALPPPTTEPPSYLSDDLKTKVQDLVNLAFTKGLTEAVKEVSKMNNAALLDAFHDVLVDQLYDVLVERGQLEKV